MVLRRCSSEICLTNKCLLFLNTLHALNYCFATVLNNYFCVIYSFIRKRIGYNAWRKSENQTVKVQLTLTFGQRYKLSFYRNVSIIGGIAWSTLLRNFLYISLNVNYNENGISYILYYSVFKEQYIIFKYCDV